MQKSCNKCAKKPDAYASHCANVRFAQPIARTRALHSISETQTRIPLALPLDVFFEKKANRRGLFSHL